MLLQGDLTMLRVCCGFALDLKHVFTRVFDNALGLLWVCLGFEKCFYKGVFDNALGFLWVCFGFENVFEGEVFDKCFGFALNLL